MENYDFIVEKLRITYERLLSDHKIINLVDFNKGLDAFNEKFSPEKLNNLDGEELLNVMSNIGNREGIPYWLEFKNDEEFSNGNYGGISGGTSFKYIMFKRNKDDNWVIGNPQKPTILSLDEAISLARDLRDNLIKGAQIIKETLNYKSDIDDYKNLQKKLEENLKYNMSNLGWVHKYYSMIFPKFIETFHSSKWQIYYLNCIGIKSDREDALYEMSGYYATFSKKSNINLKYIVDIMIDLYGLPVKCFRIGTGNDGNRYWEHMKNNSYISIGWDEIGDLRNFDESTNIKENIGKKLVDIYKIDNKNVASRKAGEILRFYKGIKLGDIVVASAGEKVLGIGRVTGDYEYVDTRPYANCRSVKWLRIFQEVTKLPKSEGNLTACIVYKNTDNLIEIQRLINEENVIIVDPLRNIKGLTLDIKNVLFRKKQIILYGPPGTGKTYNAEKACYEFASLDLFKKSFNDITEENKKVILGNEQDLGLVRMCCFHPSYGYEDFIEGIKPKVINSQTVFNLKDGIFKTLCNDAANNPDKNFYLIIDEINRGDISRIFGELIMLIESNKREKEILLPLSNTRFKVPKNVYIVGTMNNSDKSIAFLDVALRRRFGFIELMPNYDLFKGIEFEGLPLGLWLKELNLRICENLGKDARNLQIGHSYFLENEKSISDLEKFKNIIKEDIIPLIEEYCYCDYNLIGKIIGEGLVDFKSQCIKYELFNSQDTSGLISALLASCPMIRSEKEIVIENDKDDDIEDNSNANN